MRVFQILIIIVLMFSCKQTQTLPGPLQAGWKGESVCEVLFEDDDMRVLKCTFPPGVGHEKHYHNPHFGYTLAGSKFEITDNTGIQTVDVKTNSSFNKAEISEHEVLNVGDSTGVFLIVEKK